MAEIDPKVYNAANFRMIDEASDTSGASWEPATTATGTAIDKQYASDNGRLVKFTYNTGLEDKNNRAYFTIEGDTDGLIKALPGKDNSALQAIITDMQSETAGFKSFILLSINESRQEKQHILPTVSDYFAATFAGKEPQLMEISGLLPFDYSVTPTSWYINYLNAYKFLFRASILAKYKLKLKLHLKNFATYTIYPVNFNSNIQSTQDNIIHFSMTTVVAEDEIANAYGISASASAASSTAEEVEAARKAKALAQAKGEDVSPSTVGADSSKGNFLDTCNSFIDGCLTGNTGNKLAKAINTVNKTISTVNQVTGAIDTITGNKYGLRNKLKIF